MLKLLTADLIVLIHFTFILFVMFGGFLVMKWRWIICLHLPAVVWGIFIEFFGWFCPLTTWENQLRRNNGSEYSTGFIEHYIIPLIYPVGLNRDIQIVLGIALILLNLFIYTWCFRKWASQSRKLTD